MTEIRNRIFQTLIYLSFVALIIALFSFQILRYKHYHGLSLRNTIRNIPIEASRGGIYDRNGEPLAVDEISFDLVVIPQEIADIESTLKKLSKVTGMKYGVLQKNYRRDYHLPFVPARIARNLDAKKAFYIEEKLSSIPGALIISEPRRSYPNMNVGSHVVGYLGKIAKQEFENLKDYGYKIRDLVGKSGIEKYYDVYLKGERGGIQIEVDAASREVRRLGFKEPNRGKDLRLTIDLGLQRFVDMLFEDKIGTAIIMDAEEGKILALISSPNFDPSTFTTGSNRQRLKLLNNDKKPLLDRAISSSYAPGSIFKIVIASAGIATGALTQNTTFICKGSFKLGRRRFRCWKETGHGHQNIIEALSHSCNVFFYNLGRALGAEQIYRYTLQFGFGSTTGIDLPGEAKGLVPGPLWKRFYLKKPWYEGDTINYSIGQGYLLVTPIQMLRAITIVANEGHCPQPYLVEEIEDRKLSHRRSYIVRLKQDSFKHVKKGLFDVVNSSTGTGQNARMKDLHISGKTGTAQVGTKKKTHAWFVGYLPSEDPKISFVVFLEHGGQGGMEPARMVRLIGTYLNKNGFLD